MKEGPEGAKDAINRAHEILRDHGIDPYYDTRNLVFAPNQGHAVDYAKYGTALLEKAHITGDPDEVVKALQQIGSDYIDHSWKQKWAAMHKGN